MSDPATNENLRTGRGVRPSAGEQQGGTVKKGQTEPHVDKQSGWQTKTFGEVLEIRNGRNQREVESDDGEFPIYGSAGNVMGMATDYICEAGTTIIGRKGNINSPIYADTRFWNVDTAFGLAAKAGMDSRFLYFFCLSYDFSAHNRGTTIPSLVKSELLNIPIPVPPLAEQQRIVGLLDEAFEGLATAKANAEKNLQNARALFESHLQSVFTQRGPGWVEKRLEEVCGLQNGFAFKSSTFKPSGAPILRISNIQDGRIEAGNRLVFFDPKDYRENLDRYRIVEDDLLIAMSGATTGKLGFNSESTIYYLNQRVGKFEPSEKLNKRFLYHFLSTKVEENLRISAGAAQPNLSTEQIKGFVLPLPSVDEQERIVEALETLSEETQRLARLYDQKLAALDTLKKSLLHQAFTGEL